MTQNTKSRQNTSEKKVKKGDLGYFQSEKKRKLIITAILFAVQGDIFLTEHFVKKAFGCFLQHLCQIFVKALSGFVFLYN